MKKTYVHYLFGTQTLTYPALTSAKSNGLHPISTTMLAETTVGQARRVLLMAAIVKFKLINQLHDFQQIIEGIVAGRGEAYQHIDGLTYRADYPEFTTDPKIAAEQMASEDILTMKAVFTAYFELLKKNKSFNHIQTKEFRTLCSLDEELAAILGTINELVLEGEDVFKDEHLTRIYTAIDDVFLMGYPRATSQCH